MKKTLNNKEIRTLNSEIEKYDFQFAKKECVERMDDLIRKDNETLFFYLHKKIIPSLKLLLQNISGIKKVTVDMGAVKFVTNGADIMRPGIVHIEDNIEKDEPIVIIDENNKKPLAVGIALFNTEDMRNESKGKVIQNIHFVGDEIWNS